MNFGRKLVTEVEKNSKFKNAAVLMTETPQLSVIKEVIYSLTPFQIETIVEMVESHSQ